MANSELNNLVRDLVRLLGGMTKLHGELAKVMHEKLEAIKHADSNALQAIAAREGVLLTKCNEREGLRRQLTRRVLICVGEDPASVATIRLTELAEHCDEPFRSALIAATTGMKNQLLEVDRVRVAATLATQEMLKHIGIIMEAARGGVRQEVYSRTGCQQATSSASVFEAVG